MIFRGDDEIALDDRFFAKPPGLPDSGFPRREVPETDSIKPRPLWIIISI